MKKEKFINVLAKDRVELIRYSEEKTRGQVKPKGTKYVLLSIVCRECGKTHKFNDYPDLPYDSVKCDCGNWIIKYEAD